jgi:hypothetical protein
LSYGDILAALCFRILRPDLTVEDAVKGRLKAFTNGKIPGSISAIRYYNITIMQHFRLP